MVNSAFMNVFGEESNNQFKMQLVASLQDDPVPIVEQTVSSISGLNEREEDSNGINETDRE